MMKQQTAAQKPRLLVADDDPLILFTLVEGLTEAGFDVLQARDGLSAFELCKTSCPDLALLDPEFGRVLSAQANAQSAKEKQELIDGYNLIIRCQRLGVRLFLANPVNYREVLPPKCFAIGIQRALIDPATISQNEAGHFTLIPFQAEATSN